MQLSEQWDYDDDETTQQQKQGGGGLRAQLEAALKKNKELETKLADTDAKLRKEAVNRIISSKGYKPKVAKLIPREVEPTDEAITKWLEDYADIFNLEKKEEDEGEKPAPAEPNPADDAANADYARQLAAMGAATGSGMPPMKEADLMKQIMDPTMDRKKLQDLIAAHGGGFGVG